MGTLVLVRHGQASFMAADYDKLSPSGERQARLLGEHWARLGIKLDRAYSGPRVRQRHTAQIALEAMRAAGGACPELETIEALDELQAEGLSAQLAQLSRHDPEVSAIAEDYALMAQGQYPTRSYPVRIERLFTAWIESGLSLPDVEHWNDFHARVRDAVQAICARAPSGGRVVGFTSAGTISTVIQLSLGLAPAVAANLMWRVRNSSQNEFLFSKDRFSLHAFNGTPHLEDGALLTYR